MSPSGIARQAKRAGLDAAALTDHNSALNCRTFETCCRELGILPLFGIEASTIEEAHVLCLFESVEQAEELGKIIYDKLPGIINQPEKFGDQVFVDADENILGEVGKFLTSAAEISLDELFETVDMLGGMFIPAHIDRPVFSIPSQLGFLPDMKYTALETTVMPCPVKTADTPLLMNSDAHYPGDIACRYSILEAETLSFNAIRNAIRNNRISFKNL